MIILKTLANRLKECLPDIICETQSAFFPGWLITDNVLLAFEHLHYLKERPMHARKGHMALKLDMSKTYDCIEWPFTDYLMTVLGFGENCIGLIIRCVRTISLLVSINGYLCPEIMPY